MPLDIVYHHFFAGRESASHLGILLKVDAQVVDARVFMGCKDMAVVVASPHTDDGTAINLDRSRYLLDKDVEDVVGPAFGGEPAQYDLKVCLAHGGGYSCFGIGRMDRGWRVRSEARAKIQQPPSSYLSKFYYDCLTHSEPALRMLIDAVGVERVVLGTDWPFDMGIDWPVSWVLGLTSLTQIEKEAILSKNLEKLLGMQKEPTVSSRTA